MSRRGRHGRHPHPHVGARPSRPSAVAPTRPVASPRPEPLAEPRPEPVADASPVPQPVDTTPRATQGTALEAAAPAQAVNATGVQDVGGRAATPTVELAPPALNGADQRIVERPLGPAPADGGRGTTCTTAQLRRFIKSRPWIPMHELRRRFGIAGDDDDVTPVRVGDLTLFVGLPAAEGSMVGELLAGGDVGYELSLDPVTPVIVGVYPMRPVPRS